MEEELQTQLVSQLVHEVSRRETGLEDRLIYLDVNSVVPNPFQPRIRFDEKRLQDLAETIRQNGLIQPIIVRKTAGRYEIVSGERRWQASKLANLSHIPVILKSYDDRRMLESALIENLEREDLNPMEIAKAIRSLQERFNVTQDEIAAKLSKDRSTISNLLRLLSLPEEVQQLLMDGKIEFGHAKAILSLQPDSARIELGRKIAAEGWSVRRAEAEVRRLTKSISLTESQAEKKDASLEFLENEFRRLLGSEVVFRLQTKGGACRGMMEVRIQTKEDVDRILGIVRKGVVESRTV